MSRAFMQLNSTKCRIKPFKRCVHRIKLHNDNEDVGIQELMKHSRIREFRPLGDSLLSTVRVGIGKLVIPCPTYRIVTHATLFIPATN